MALPTGQDNINAMLYALDRMKRERCTRAASLPNSGVKYESAEKHRVYPCHSGLRDCEHGKCKINTKAKCDSVSQLPFDAITGDPFPKTKCNTDSDCPQNLTCASDKTCVPKNPYLEFRDGKCVYGNFALLKWCRFPNQRRAQAEAGVTNVPPFQYDSTKGACQITKDYCDWMGVSFKNDANGEPTCYTKAGQLAGEFLVGKTIFRKLRGVKGKEKGDLVSKDFAGKNVSLFLTNGRLSFDVDEVKKAYPDLVTVDDSIEFTKDDLTDPHKKRLFFVLRHSQWISQPFVETIAKNL